jgi:transcriptional regulator with XRE-family HTH domain
MAKKVNITEEMLRNQFGKNLRRLRKQANLSQVALAGESKLTNTFINDIENGKKWLSCDTMARLCKVLHAEPHQFFFPLTSDRKESSEILSAYIDDFSESIMRTLTEFKAQYLSEK